MNKTLVIALTLAFATYGCQESQTPPDDATSDATVDAVVDAGADAVVDAGPDAVVDTGPDGEAASGPDAEVPPGPSCTSGLEGDAPLNTKLCEIEGRVRHVRIENIWVPASHASAQLYLGLTAPQANPQGAIAADQLKVQIYGGGPTGPAPQLGVYFGTESFGLGEDNAWVNDNVAPRTICFDVHEGSASSRAAFVLWIDGANGADCHDKSTLTFANAHGFAYATANGEVADADAYYYQAGSVSADPVVVLENALAVPVIPPPTCTQAVTTTSAARYAELCEIGGNVRHVRLSGFMADGAHKSAQLLIGYPAPTNMGAPPAAPTSSSQWKVELYGGAPGQADPQITSYAGTVVSTVEGDHTFVRTPSTICFDIHDGSDTTPPYFVLWRDGESGADCEDFATLTTDNAYAVELVYDHAHHALDKSGPLYFYSSTYTYMGSPAVTNVTIFNNAALTPAEAAAGVTCTTTWVSNNEFQPLCTPRTGQARHIRIEDAMSTTNSKYFYLLMNEPAPLTGTGQPPMPGVGDGRFQFVGGRDHTMSSVSYFRFNGNATTPTPYMVGNAALYSAAHDVCLDVIEQEGSPNVRVVFWATRTGSSNCSDRSTLTAANALFDSTMPANALFDAPRGSTGTHYIKISGTTAGATLGNIVVSSEPALY